MAATLVLEPPQPVAVHAGERALCVSAWWVVSFAFVGTLEYGCMACGPRVIMYMFRSHLTGAAPAECRTE